MAHPVGKNPSKATEIAQQLAGERPSRETLAYIRREALASGVWSELAVRFPEYFREAFALKGTEQATFVPPVPSSPQVAAVPEERLRRLAGEQAFLRVRRADGRHEVIAATIDAVKDSEIVVGAFDLATTERLMQAGDTPAYRAPKAPSATPPLLRNPGDMVVTAVKLPLDMPSVGVPQKRITLRHRAEAVARGEYAPRVDLLQAERYLVRDANGEVLHHPDNKPVFEVGFATDVKVEQNVLATPLVHELTRRAIERLAEPELLPRLAAASTWKEMEHVFWTRLVLPLVGEMCESWVAQPETPLGRAYANLIRIVDFNFTFFASTLPGADTMTAGKLLEGGLFTAFTTLCDVACLSANLAHANPELSASAIVRNSLPLVLRLASAHMHVFQATNHALGMDQWRRMHERVELVNRDGKPRLEPNSTGLEELHRRFGLRPDTVVLGTTGCPAGHSIGAGNPIQQFTNAFADMLDKLPELPTRAGLG